MFGLFEPRGLFWETRPPFLGWPPDLFFKDGYLVDPASSHMLVLKAKPCMSKFKQFKRETANGSLIQS